MTPYTSAAAVVVLASAGAASASVIQDALQEALSAIQSNSTAAMAADMVDAASGLAMQASEKPAAVSAGAIALLALYLFLSWYYKPLFWMRKQEDVGYVVHGQTQNARDVSDVTRKRRRRGELPPAYPNGWFRLVNSYELKKGQVKNVDALGQHFAVFRGHDGEAAVLDAYCPHLGANLAVGGKVLVSDEHGSCLQCPFHGWTFAAKTGKVVNIPYADKIPETAKTKKWPALEMNGTIMVWYDAEDRDPMWFPPELKEITSGQWTFRGISEHIINAHIQEIPENAADIAHLDHVHSPALLTGTDLRKMRQVDGSRSMGSLFHTWDASYTPGEGDMWHTSVLKLKHGMKLWGYPFPALDLLVTARQVGPGLVYLTWDSAFGSGVFTQSITPMGPLEQNLQHCIWASWTVPNWLAKVYLAGEAMQVERDVMIWNNKCFINKPMLVKEDQLIGKFRRWYKQFYSENSEKRAKESSAPFDW